MLFLILIAAVVMLDLCLKDEIERTKDDVFPKKLAGTDGYVTVMKCHNPGLPFGCLRKYPQLVRELPLAVASAAAGVLLWLLPRKGSRLQKLGLALTVGGAAGNLYDRFVRGYVVDYLNVRLGRLRKVIFNVADVCILAGSVIFLIGEMVSALRER